MVGRSPRAMWYGAAREDEESLSQDDIQDLQPRFRFMVLDCSRVTNVGPGESPFSLLHHFVSFLLYSGSFPRRSAFLVEAPFS